MQVATEPAVDRRPRRVDRRRHGQDVPQDAEDVGDHGDGQPTAGRGHAPVPSSGAITGSASGSRGSRPTAGSNSG
jgi:hypothetical protein